MKNLSLASSFVLTFSIAVLPSRGEEPPPTLSIEGRVAFTEGPAWNPVDGNVYFTDIENNRIMRRDPTGAFHVYRIPSGRANGLVFDASGRLHACEGGREGGNRRVTRTEKDGSVTVLTADFEGGRYNSPNDLCLDAEGRVYFTDPRYGDRDDMQITDADGKPVEGVYRIDPGGSVEQVLAHEVERPNGIGLSPDERFLYVADNQNSTPDGNRKLWRFERREDGSIDPASRTLLFDWAGERGPDGLCVGENGLLYVTAGLNFASHTETARTFRAGIYVIDPESGELRDFWAVPEDMITNCTIGGEEGNTLYITAGHKLWSLPLGGE